MSRKNCIYGSFQRQAGRYQQPCNVILCKVYSSVANNLVLDAVWYNNFLKVGQQMQVPDFMQVDQRAGVAYYDRF